MHDERRPELRLEAPEPAIDLIPVLERTTGVCDGTINADIQGANGSLPSLKARGPIDASDEDPMQPGGEPIGVAQRAKVTPCQDQRLLDRILRQVAVAQHELRDVEQAGDRLFRQSPEGIPVATLRTLNQVALHVRLETAPV